MGTVWVIADRAEAVEGAYAAIDGALVRRAGHRLLISVPGGDVAALRRRLPHEMSRGSVDRFSNTTAT